MTEQNEPKQRIVVGVDGSPSSIDALRWAIDQAGTRGAAIEALTVWQHPVSTGWTVPIEADEDLATIMSKVLDDAVAQAAGPQCPIEIRPRVLQGGTVSCLLDAARGADLLVVGSRGHGGFVGALLGSVSGHCVQHAPCPVVVVRHSTA
ncbi:universal stress protein [Kitasatospora sp. NPDC101155]|uniref:universal stress protein n=1 Tax=Kitasatospora sp. NPDC101155 TaxID=3364097 RepID=UPI003807EE37